MEAQQLTDADFLPADPSPSGADAGVSSDNFGGYPAWSSDAPAAPTDAPPGLIALDAGTTPDTAPATSPDLPLADDNLFTSPTPDASEDATPTAEADTAAEPPVETPAQKTAREQELEARLAAEQEARTALETQQRQQRYYEIEAAAQADLTAVQAHIQRVWNQEVARANGMAPAARTQHLNKVIADRDAYIQNAQAKIAERRGERLQEILYHDPTVREGYYTQVIQEYALPPEARADLAALPPELLDDYLPSLQRFYQSQTSDKAEIKRLRAELAAAQRLASGADVMGGNRPAGGRRDPRFDTNSDQYDPSYVYTNMGGWVSR